MKHTTTWAILMVLMCIAIATASERKPGYSAVSSSIVAILSGKVDVVTAREVPEILDDGSTAHVQEITYIDADPKGNTHSLNMVIAVTQAVADKLNIKLAQIHITVVNKDRKARARIQVNTLANSKMRLKWFSAVMGVGPAISKTEQTEISTWSSSWKIERLDSEWKCMLQNK